MTLAFAVCFALAWPFGAGSFGTRQIALGFALQLIYNLVHTLAWVVNMKRRFGSTFPYGDRFRAGMESFDALVVDGREGLVRWAQLFDWSEKGGPEARTPAALTAHRDGDSQCPCARLGCGGSTPGNLLWGATSELVYRTSHSLVSQLAMLWTSLVTLGPTTWSQPWSAVLNVLGVLSSVMIATEVLAVSTTHPSIMRLTSRLRFRALSLSLGQLVDTCAAGLDKGACADVPEAPMAYAELLALLGASWKRHFRTVWTAQVWAFYMLVLLLLSALSAFIGRCIPAWMLLYLLYNVATIGRELWNAATFNAEIQTVAELVARSRRELRELLSLRPFSPHAPAVRAHDAVLGSHLRVGDSRAKVLGFVVSFGAIRTLYITLATVAFGVWGVLRGFGVEVTMDAVCPG
ncbi:hypothetical protein DFJ74DRAFT_686319, partial [Hyaloraphidium curvatum]